MTFCIDATTIVIPVKERRKVYCFYMFTAYTEEPRAKVSKQEVREYCLAKFILYGFLIITYNG